MGKKSENNKKQNSSKVKIEKKKEIYQNGDQKKVKTNN